MNSLFRSAPASPAMSDGTFSIDGVVFEVLMGCGLASIRSSSEDVYTVDRTTPGVNFEDLRPGQRIQCRVESQWRRVLDAQLEQPRGWPSGSPLSKPCLMSKEEFIAEYCRRWGVVWADIATYRVALPCNDGVGWTMGNINDHEFGQTQHGPLAPQS